jgi:hypothetical protein
MVIVSGFVALVAVTLVAFCLYMTRKRGQLEALGIPVVKQFLVFGSPPFALHKITWKERKTLFGISDNTCI